MEPKKRLGELLVQQKIVNQKTINDALRVQVSSNRRLGHILLQMKVLSDDQLASTLSQQLEIPLTNIDQSFSTKVKQILPRYLCTKYGVLPLSLENNNIMLTAMADPSDLEAINDIEHYTGKIIEPRLAKQSAINKAINQKIPYSIKDFFNPLINTRLTRIVAIAAFALVVILGVTTYNFIQTARYGTITHLNNSTIYEHHDLMVGFDNSGKISLLGHSAFSDGYYSASFNNTPTLRAFLASSKDDFSNDQKEWLDWVISNENTGGTLSSEIATGDK